MMSAPIAPSRLMFRQSMLALLLCMVVSAAWIWLPNPLLALAVGLLPFVVWLVFRSPFLMVLLFVLFSFFRLHEAYPQLYPLRIPQLLALASIASLAWHLWVTCKMQIYWRRELSLLSLFALLCAVGVLLASNRGVAQAYFNGVFSKIYIMTLAIAWLMRAERDFSRAALAFVLAGMAIASVALQNAAAGVEMVEGTRVTIGRSIGSMLGDPNDLALVLQFPLGFAVALALSRHQGRVRQLIGVIAVVMLVLAILATQSRGGLLGILTVTALFAWRRVENKAMLLSAAAMALPVLFVLAGVSERASGGAAEEGIDESAMGRLYAWEAAFYMALRNPLSGVGLDNFYANYYFYSQHWDGKNHAVHSTWFGVLAETGFVGLLVFVALLVAVIRTAWRNLSFFAPLKQAEAQPLTVVSEAMLAGLLGTAVSGTFLTQGFTWPIYIFTGLIVAMAKLREQWRDSSIAKC